MFIRCGFFLLLLSGCSSNLGFDLYGNNKGPQADLHHPEFSNSSSRLAPLHNLISKYDGSIVSIPPNYDSHNSIPGARIHDIFVDENGTTYLASDAGISIRNAGESEFRTLTIANGLPASAPRKVAVNSTGAVFVLCGQNLAVSRSLGEDFYILSQTWGLYSRLVEDIYLSQSGDLYVLHPNGLSVLRKGFPNFKILAADSLPGGRESLHAGKNGDELFVKVGRDLWLSTDGGLSFSNPINLPNPDVTLFLETIIGAFRYIPHSRFALMREWGYQALDESHGLRSNRLNDLIHYGDSEVIAATEEGLSISSFHNQDPGGPIFRTLTTENGLIDNYVTSVFVAKDGSIHAATLLGYSWSTDGENFTSIPLSRDTAWGQIHKIHVDLRDNIYLGTDYGLFVSSDGGQGFRKIPTLSGEIIQVRDFRISNRGEILAATHIDLFRSTPDGLKRVASNINGTASIALSSDLKIYIGTLSLGLRVSVDGGNHFERVRPEGELGTSIRQVHIDPVGRIFALAPEGLYYSEDRGRSFARSRGLLGAGTKIRFFVDGKTIYVAGTEGLLKSTDAGKEFTLISDIPHSDVVATGSHIIAASHFGVVYSSNGGDTFQLLPQLEGDQYLGTRLLLHGDLLFIGGSYRLEASLVPWYSGEDRRPVVW